VRLESFDQRRHCPDDPGQCPADREWRLGHVLGHLAQAGDVPRVTGPSGRTNMASKGLLGGQRTEQTWARLFLTRMELTALAVLLTDRFGWNLAVLDRMPAPVRTPSAGETTTITYQVQVEKRRRGGGHWFSTENITRQGPPTSPATGSSCSTTQTAA
jgi:hypothetical protein